MNGEHLLWVEKYRPHKIEQCILPEELKKTFSEYVAQGNVPNLILAGGPGMGKTTVARAMCDEIGLDYIMINGSNESNIDTLRTKIVGYAGAVSLTGGRKVVIIDEADYLNPNSTQPAFRGVIEEFAQNCSFVFTCNYKNRLIDPLHSRCAVVDFKITKEQAAKIALQLFKRISVILVEERVEYDKDTVVALIMKHFPDFRRILNELQRYSVSGKIDKGIFENLDQQKIDTVVGHLRDKNFRDLRTWVGQNLDNDSVQLMKDVYKQLTKFIAPQFVPMSVVILGKYLDYATRTPDQEVNLMAFFSELMIECDMKKEE